MDAATLDLRVLAQEVRTKSAPTGDALERIQDSVNSLNKILGDMLTASPSGNKYLDLTRAAAGSLGNFALNRSGSNAISITGTDIVALTITAANIANATITAIQIANATITGTQIANVTIAAANIVNNTITATQIANNTITAALIVNNTITALQIANTTITASQIANVTITATQIANLTITAGQIANATITNVQIANATITEANIYSLSVGGGTGRPGTLDVYDGTPTLIGKIGNLGSSNYGIWGKQVWAGGTGPSDAPFKTDTSGRVSIDATDGAAGGAIIKLTKDGIISSVSNITSAYGYIGFKVENGSGYYSGLVYDGHIAVVDGGFYQLSVNKDTPSIQLANSLSSSTPAKVTIVAGNTGAIISLVHEASGGFYFSKVLLQGLAGGGQITLHDTSGNMTITLDGATGNCQATSYNVGATPGLASFSGAVTNLTVVNGIVTAAS